MALQINQLKILGDEYVNKYFSDIDDNVLEQEEIPEINLEEHKSAIIEALTHKKNTQLSPLSILKAAHEGWLQEFNAINSKSIFSKISPNTLIKMNNKERDVAKLISDIKDKKIEPKAFKIILTGANNIPKQETSEEATNATKQGLSDCVNTMIQNDIPLTQNFGRNKLGRLLQCSDDQLAAAGNLLKYLDRNKALIDHKILAKNTFDYLVENKFSSVQANGFIEAFEAMKEVGIPIRGNRQPLMEKFKNKPHALKNFNDLLQGIKAAGVKIEQQDFNILLQAANLEAKGPAFGQCIKAMKDNKDNLFGGGINLGINIGSELALERMAKMTKEQLEGTGRVLESLNKQASLPDKKSYLDRNTFNYILAHPEAMQNKGRAIADAFSELRNQRIPLEGLRQPIMTMQNPEQFTQAMKSLNGTKLDKNEIKSLIKHLPQSKDSEGLGKSIKALKEAGLSLTTLNPLGSDRIKQLANLDNKAANAVTTLLTSLTSAKALGSSSLDLINGDTFDYLVNHAQDLSEGEPLSKAAQAAEVFTKMHEAGITVAGHRRPIMAMKNEELKNLATVLAPMKSMKPPLNKKEFNTLVKGLGEHKGSLSETYCNSLGECIKLMRAPENDLSLTTLKPFTDSRLSQLAEVPAEELPAVQTILKSLSGKLQGNLTDRQGDIFDYLMDKDKRAKLNEKLPPEGENVTSITKADLLAKVFGQMKDARIEISGNRRKLLNMESKQLKNLSAILGPLTPTNPQAKSLSSNEFKALINHAEYFNETDPDSTRGENLGKCIKAMQENEIALTSLLPGDKNLDRLAALDPAELTAVTKILEMLAGTKPSSLGANKTNLFSNDTFNYLMDHAADLKNATEINSSPTKADLIVDVFKTMQAAGISIPGHRQQVMNKDQQALKNLAAVLAPMKDMRPPLNKKEFNALVKGLGEQKESLSETYCNSLGECIKLMRAPENDLSLTTLKPFTDSRLSQLAEVPAEELPAVQTILKSLSGKLQGNLTDRQGDIFDYLMDKDNRAKLNEKLPPEGENATSITKADLLAKVFGQMKDARIEISGNRRKLLNMEPGQLKNLSAILAPLSQAKPLSQKEFSALIKHAESFKMEAPERGNHLGSCIKAMQNNNISLTTILPGVDSKITHLAKLNPKNELPGVASLLTNLAGENAIRKPSFLDENTFDYIVNNAEALASKAELITKIFDEMRKAGVPISGHRKPIMKMEKNELEALHKTMEALNKDNKYPLNKDSFTALRDQSSTLSDIWTDPEHAKNFCACLANLKKNEIGFTKLFQPIRGDDKVAKLAKLNPGSLKAVATVLDSLGAQKSKLSREGKLLNSDTFENILKRAEDLAQEVGPGKKTKADYVADAYKALRNNSRPIVGARQAIMDLNEKQLQAFTNTVNTATGVSEFNSKAQIKRLVENSKKIENPTVENLRELSKKESQQLLTR